MYSIYNMKKIVNSKIHIGIFMLRLFVSFRLFYGVVDNIISWERMIEFANFLQDNGFPFPIPSAVLSVYIQAIGALFILIGYHIQITSSILIVNFIIAILVHMHLGDNFMIMTPALTILFCCITFIFTGAGKLSVGKFITSRNDKSYLG